MSQNDRSSRIAVEDDNSKMRQYMQLNKQLTRSLTAQRNEASNLKMLLRASTADLIHQRTECNQWKNNYEALSKLYLAHITSFAKTLQSNADSFNQISDDSPLADTCRELADQIVTSPKTVPRRADESRRLSKSFESVGRSQKQRRNGSSDAMLTIEEEEQEESEMSAELRAELMDSSGNDNIIDSSKVESDEDSKNSLCEEILERSRLSDGEIDEQEGTGDREIGTSYEESGASEEESGASEDESGASDQESGASDEESGRSVAAHDETNAESGSSDQESDVSQEETIVDGASDQESGVSDEESGVSDESGPSDEESGRRVDAHDETNAESGSSDHESDVSKDESLVDVVNVVENEVVNGNESASEEESAVTSDAESDSDSVDRTSILKANDDSTTTNDDSDKENTTSNGSTLTHSNSENTESVISLDSETFKKSTPASRKLPANKRKAHKPDQSMSTTYRRMTEVSLVSSTPFRIDASSSDTSESSTSNTTITSSSITSSRPRRKAAPVMLLEPKLNTKMRRPR